MADFGDYAGQYLTMARSAPQQMDTLVRLGEFKRDQDLKQQFAPSLMMSQLYGSPFEREKQAEAIRLRQEQQRMNQLAQLRLVQSQEEAMRHNRATEMANSRQNDMTNRIRAYEAAMKAYEQGVGPHPGEFPTQGGQQASPAPSGQQAPQMSMPTDLMQLPPGIRNKAWGERIADKPAAISKMQGLETSLDQMIDEAKQLSEHPSIVSGSGWTGIVTRNTPDFTATGARNFGERMKALGAQIGFNALTNMREMSKTGGALGQVSDFENRRLEAAIAALDAQQSPEGIKRALRQVMNYANSAKQNMRDAYQRTYNETAPKFEKHEIVPPTGKEDQGLIFNGYKFPSKEKLDAYRKAIGG